VKLARVLELQLRGRFCLTRFAVGFAAIGLWTQNSKLWTCYCNPDAEQGNLDSKPVFSRKQVEKFGSGGPVEEIRVNTGAMKKILC